MFSATAHLFTFILKERQVYRFGAELDFTPKRENTIFMYASECGTVSDLYSNTGRNGSLLLVF